MIVDGLRLARQGAVENPPRRGMAAINVAVAALLMTAAAASAQDFPSKNVRIVASEAGGSGDFVVRVVAQGLAGAFGQQVAVDNRGGGVVAGDAVAKSSPDGHTILLYGNTLWLLPLMRKQIPYDPYRDFAPVTMAARAVNVLVVHPSLPVKSVKDLIALARARPGELNFSSAAPGTMNHLAAELFKSMAKINIVRVSARNPWAARRRNSPPRSRMRSPGWAGSSARRGYRNDRKTIPRRRLWRKSSDWGRHTPPRCGESRKK